ncbi:MAG: hypothetical protein Q4G60_11440 [bacterium]|nr:hypothetical protein [bacterium]
MKKQTLIYTSAIAILDAVVFLSYLYGRITGFVSLSLAVALFLPFVAYMFLEIHLCSRFGFKIPFFSMMVMGISFLSMLLFLLLAAMITRSLYILEGIGRMGLFLLYAYGCMVGLRLLWQCIQQIRTRL